MNLGDVMKRCALVLMSLTIVLCAQPAPSVSASPPVAVSIKPLHSLVAGVMRGVGAPDLLIKGAASPHTFSLKPSDARMLARARVIFWVGHALTPGLERPLETLPRKARVVALGEVPGVRRLQLREGGLWEGGAHHHGDAGARKEEEGAHDDHENFDAHLWLDPMNARKWVDVVAHVLGEAVPENKEKYEANARNLKARIDALHEELGRALKPLQGAPYVVFHDAYQYLERRYGLQPIGSVALSPETKPGTARLLEIRRKVRNSQSVCVFTEPQFPPRLVETIVQGTGAKTGVLDPLGAGIPAGEDAYFILMRDMAQSLKACLSLNKRGARAASG